jgi:hypothetical protein
MVSIIVNDESRRIQKFDPFGLTIIYPDTLSTILGATVPTKWIHDTS